MSRLWLWLSLLTLPTLALGLAGCSRAAKDNGKGAESGNPKEGDPTPKGTDVTPKQTPPNPPPQTQKEIDHADFPGAIIGRWKCLNPSSAFHHFGFAQTEFTKDGRVLQFDAAQKKWVERYKYRFEKADLILISPKVGGGSTEARISIAGISQDNLVATSPPGELKRLWAPHGGTWDTTETLLFTNEQAQKEFVAGSFQISPDGSRYAFARKKGKQFEWVVDGKAGPAVDRTLPKNFVFSADSKHYLYAAEMPPNMHRLYLDGLPQPGANEGIGTVSDLVLSKDGKQFAYFTTKGGTTRLFIDGKDVEAAAGKYTRVFAADTIHWVKLRDGDNELVVDGVKLVAPGPVSKFEFSANCKTYAYQTRVGKEEFVVVNGKPQKRFTEIISNISISADGEHVAYTGKDEMKRFTSYDNTWHELGGLIAGSLALSPDGKRWGVRVGDSMVIDGKKSKQYPQGVWAKSGPMFSPDSQHYAHTTIGAVVRDGVEQTRYAQISPAIAFSPDGRFLAYPVREKPNGDRVLTVDGEQFANPFADYLDAAGVSFSPDSKSIGLVAKQKGDWFAVLDGQEQKRYDAIGPEATRIGFTPEGAYTFIAVREGNYYWVEARRKP